MNYVIRIVSLVLVLVICFSSVLLPEASALEYSDSLGEVGFYYQRSDLLQWIVNDGAAFASSGIGASLVAAAAATSGAGLVIGAIEVGATALATFAGAKLAGCAIDDALNIWGDKYVLEHSGFNRDEVVSAVRDGVYEAVDDILEEAGYSGDFSSASSNPSPYITVHLPNVIASATLDEASSDNASSQYLELVSVDENIASYYGLSSNDNSGSTLMLNFSTDPFVWEYESGRYDVSINYYPWDFIYNFRWGLCTFVYSSLYDSDGNNVVFFDGGSRLYIDDFDTSILYSVGSSYYFTKGTEYSFHFTVSYSPFYTVDKYNNFIIGDLSVDNVNIGEDAALAAQPEPETRPSSFMGALAAGNSLEGSLIDGSLLDYSGNLVFVLGDYDSGGSLDGVYSPAVYDEETLIFTEPVTGAQYQTSGWTYDYTSRSYDIEVESGTFLIGASDITRIVCTYGDDAVTIVYYDASGNAVQSDEFAYVMVSHDPCSLTGHVNSVETKKEATCTSTGERVYTCTVCGNVEVEDIPMKGHSHKYSEIRSPTCTDTGLALYSCSTCGDEVSEALDPLGHDWLATETVETTYSLPDGTSCPDCSGTDFVSDLDVESETCTCICNYCDASWRVNADVELGYTVYTCSRCDKTRIEYDGESGDGLFKSIGNFIANGIQWCTEKLKQLVENLQTIVDTFNEYVEIVGQQNSTYPSFITAVMESLPADLMAVIWFGVIVFVVLAVIKIWFR